MSFLYRFRTADERKRRASIDTKTASIFRYVFWNNNTSRFDKTNTSISSRHVFAITWNGRVLTLAVPSGTCIRPMVPVESILDASFTVFPHMSYTGFRAPMTPPTKAPQLMPAVHTNQTRGLRDDKHRYFVLQHRTT